MIFVHLCYLLFAVVWAGCVHYFFASAGQPAPHLQRQSDLYMAFAYVPALLLAASGLTSRATRVGYAVRAMALVGVGAAVSLACIAALFGIGFAILGGTLPARVVVPVQWGGVTLGVALGFLVVDVFKRTSELMKTW